jgi:hypothetical protein
VGKAATAFPEGKVVMSIYGGHAPYEFNHKLKLTSQAINATSPATLEYLQWSKSQFTFDRTNHPDSITMPGRFLLVVNPLVGTTRLTKALMEGGSGLNIMYLETFEGLGLTWDQLQNSPHPFYGVVSGKQSIPLEWVTLPVTFRDTNNYLTERLTFEGVDFSRPYHVILGQPCYVKFMAVPSYANLKLKILGPTRVITVEAKTQRAQDYEQNNIELTATAVTMVELRELSLQVPMISIGPAMPPSVGAFNAPEDANAM